jgi:hypothetical protein
LGQRFRERPRQFCQPRPLWAVGLLLVLALVLRLGHVAVTPGHSVVDDARDLRHPCARSIDASQGCAHIGPGPAGRTAFRPPGYPYLLAGADALSGVERAQTSTRVVVGRVANALVGTVIVALTAPGSARGLVAYRDGSATV